MNTLKIKGHFTLTDQTWENINKGVNIITSVNGGGKTSLLQHIFNTHHKDYVIRNISQNIAHFDTQEELADYKERFGYLLNQETSWEFYLKKPQRVFNPRLLPRFRREDSYQNFMTDYKTLLELRDAEEEVAVECNNFFDGLGLKIQIQNWTRNSGRLRFYRKNKPETLIEFANISTGEKTAFVLWLIMRSNPTPQIILLDEFDSGLDEDSIPKFVENLVKIAEKGVQIFISTHRKNSLSSFTTETKKNNSDGTSKYTIWNINSENGIIK